MSEHWAYYFGFGSLVNRNTRPANELAIDASLRGWARVWNHRVSDHGTRAGCTSLSIEPTGDDIQGVVVRIPEAQLPQLDQRESGYERMSLDISLFDIEESLDAHSVYVYRSLPKNRYPADQSHPIVQSYIDCVMAGYLARFGERGLLQMISSTRGWQGPIINDRQSPTYPRHVQLSAELHDYFDKLLATHRP